MFVVGVSKGFPAIGNISPSVVGVSNVLSVVVSENTDADYTIPISPITRAITIASACRSIVLDKS